MHPMINTAVKAARRAATIINRASFDLDQVRVTRKEHNDFVTEVDKAAEEAIIDVLKSAYPDHAILAEESGAQRRNAPRLLVAQLLQNARSHAFEFRRM